MIPCIYCEADAELELDGVGICAKCSSEPPAGTDRPQTERQIRAVLQRDILASTARADTASRVLIAIMKDIPSGMPHPDGSQRIQNAARALAAARGEVMQAHSRLNEFLGCGIIPDDLKPAGRA